MPGQPMGPPGQPVGGGMSDKLWVNQFQLTLTPQTSGWTFRWVFPTALQGSNIWLKWTNWSYIRKSSSLKVLEDNQYCLVWKLNFSLKSVTAFVGFEGANKYSVKNSLGQKVYHAVEDNDCCTRNCCGPIRPFDMKIIDNTQREVIHLYRPLRCDSCWCPCFLQQMEVSSPPGNLIGYVTQEWSILVPKFRIENSAGETVLRIEGMFFSLLNHKLYIICSSGPFCTFSMCGDVEFQVLSRDGSMQLGKITKQWTGLIREAFTDAGIYWPLVLTVDRFLIKVTLLSLVVRSLWNHISDGFRCQH